MTFTFLSNGNIHSAKPLQKIFSYTLKIATKVGCLSLLAVALFTDTMVFFIDFEDFFKVAAVLFTDT
jgi:hypothetical protein